MARWFRSEPMEYISIIVNEDAAHDCLSDLGNLGTIQFTDLNPDLTPFQRRYVSYVKRCDELERKLRYFGNECDKFDLSLASAGTAEKFLASNTNSGGPSPKRETGTQLLETLEAELGGYESQLTELNSYSEKLTREYNEKAELQEVLTKTRKFYDGRTPRLAASGIKPALESDKEESMLEDQQARDMDMRFSSITGVVASDEKIRFERMAFRATRGNCFIRFGEIKDPITDPETGTDIQKHVFIIFYKSSTIGTKIKKICDAFSAHRYNLPDMNDANAIERQLAENAQELVDSQRVLSKNKDSRQKLCQMLSRYIAQWTWTVVREKAVYHSLNFLKADVQGMLRGEGWVVATDLEKAKLHVERAHANMDMDMPSMVDVMPTPWPTPPTHFETNKFTYAYQEFVNTYGIPRYREANPALFTAATFPFLFGIMYGDMGHGLFLLCAGLYLIYNEKANDNAKLSEIMGGLHSGRYMFTMMGACAVYAGVVYNDAFSLGINFFKSRWEFEELEEGTVGTIPSEYGSYGSSESVYPFGLDPIWHVASNELLFFNSFKMKVSVILGIFQMFMGTCLRGINAIYFGETLDFLFEFLPMVTFAVSLFMYMVILIFMKWSINWNSRMLSATCIEFDSDGWGVSDYEGEWGECNAQFCTPAGFACTMNGTQTTADLCPLDFGGSGDGCQPPNLITTLINIALSPGNVDEPMYHGQANTQNWLLLIAFLSIPVLLLAKPYYLSKQGHSDEHGEDGEDHSFGEIIIHQAIETIEFVLGMVSNTASYLRLWALSLAHTELAGVFWSKCMLTTMSVNGFAVYLGFGAFAGCTFGVLLMMDVLECFLHALRLHWVEFQNKFFKADGIRFNPFSFEALLKAAEL
mmetsp:Transcript_30620/g.70091  ORF Transcript_30620/g.70091 Transcript_30620/m.70091 type:complete len:869 (-) Transcript_30620:166-2772(-)|eukprot:CAMPEP_0113310090 /NCGR_PEP_ID=MMETSP0010_2-20120614/7871_1 /TAXON_ID=216773 ORGANISM="Corethron hystrix, Strain 308" /NCGR_SAMPLE_ID=MMETSP0010_2 /ASSEMBLY_ACC=CAM_ASM_000155 /LENGTH=868 /DNA_ID=CAMNT_0000165469 /DNA_START=300 /DNA_END=2906 /DNA_ORIENTATION=+ /assembly_acc=CAM_ASM_000155